MKNESLGNKDNSLIAISSGYRKFMGKLYIIGNLFVGWHQHQYREAEYRTSPCYSEHENAFWRNLIFWFNYCLNVHHYRGTKCTLQFSPKEIQGTFNKFQKSPDWLLSSSKFFAFIAISLHSLAGPWKFLLVYFIFVWIVGPQLSVLLVTFWWAVVTVVKFPP